MSRSPLAHLPLDTLDDILCYVPLADLVSVCGACKTFQPHALNALYRVLRLTNTGSLKACFSLIDNPTLAARVRRLSIRCEEAGSFLGVIQETLEILCNLQSLEIFMGEASVSSCQWILPDPCPFQLRSFSTDFHYTSQVGNFITRHSSLSNLTVPWEGGQDDFGKVEMRYLTKICAPFSLVEALVPGRPIREVKILPNIDLTTVTVDLRNILQIQPRRISCLTKSTATIERLQINMSWLRQIGPQLLAATLPSLSCLTVSVDEKTTEQDFLADRWAMDFIGAFPPLHCFNVQFERFTLMNFGDMTPFLIALDSEQQLEFFGVASRLYTYAAKRVGTRWIPCSAAEAAWVSDHSTGR
ncbi:hypothetical protein K438DRAFT_1967882 [Mycena galopus ATCC 62051]|nr:hypothetical protein K438DRAFT_1967882 [Mycena galopus ATCC 62051]